MYFKVVKDGYIVMVGSLVIGEQISKSEYDDIRTMMSNKPIPREGYEYLLRDSDLTWVEVEIPPEPPEEGEDDVVI
ncbi:MAG: hypothetical protein IIZ35_00035 [Clostridia bacterium]|nr:hypothetical protein [Clostridia bacterium]